MEQLKIIVDENGLVEVWKDGIEQTGIKSIDFHADNEHIGKCELKTEQSLMRKEKYKLPEYSIVITGEDLKAQQNAIDEAIKNHFEHLEKMKEESIKKDRK